MKNVLSSRKDRKVQDLKRFGSFVLKIKERGTIFILALQNFS